MGQLNSTQPMNVMSWKYWLKWVDGSNELLGQLVWWIK